MNIAGKINGSYFGPLSLSAEEAQIWLESQYGDSHEVHWTCEDCGFNWPPWRALGVCCTRCGGALGHYKYEKKNGIDPRKDTSLRYSNRAAAFIRTDALEYLALLYEDGAFDQYKPREVEA